MMKSWKLPKELTTVTPLSKTLAMVLFITLPAVSFVAGMYYQATSWEIFVPPYPIPAHLSVVSPSLSPQPSPKPAQMGSCTGLNDTTSCPDGYTCVAACGPPVIRFNEKYVPKYFCRANELLKQPMICPV